MQLTLLPTALLALLPVASAGYSYGGSSGASPSTGNSAAAQNSGTPAAAAGGVTVINVGQNPLKMEPNDVTVPQGGIIEFRFFTGAHSVAQSAFDSPCTPLNATAANGAEGFFSGSQAVSSGQGPNVFRVTSTGSPMWYYCATARHCQGGMVGVINKPANNAARTVELYAAAAANAPQNIAPASVKGGELVAATGTGTASSPTRTPGAAAGLIGNLHLGVAGAAVAFAAAFAL